MIIYSIVGVSFVGNMNISPNLVVDLHSLQFMLYFSEFSSQPSLAFLFTETPNHIGEASLLPVVGGDGCFVGLDVRGALVGRRLGLGVNGANLARVWDCCFG